LGGCLFLVTGAASAATPITIGIIGDDGAASNRVFPSIGNHDWPFGVSDLAPDLDYFSLPASERYYSYGDCPVEIFAVVRDQQESDGATPGSRQALWLSNALARLHRSQVVLPAAAPGPVEAGLEARVARAERNLQTQPNGPDLVKRFRVCAQQIRERAASGRPQTQTPIHGALGWHCIH